MHPGPSVFLETSALKASADTSLILVPKPQKVKWGDGDLEVAVYLPVLENQNVKYLRNGNRERFEDTVCLRFIAALGKEGKINLLCHDEVFFELMGLPRATGEGLTFYGAPIQWVEGPVRYERIVVDGSGCDHQFELLSTLEHPGFKELQRACGAYQGDDRPLNRNQLIDAFHILCAESAGADFLLTLDDKLIRTASNHKSHKVGVTCITPKRLIATLISRRPTWLFAILKEQWRIARSGRNLSDSRQDASREFWS